MNVFDETTRNREITVDTFKEAANVFFRLNNLEFDWSKEECEEILAAADQIADNLKVYEGDELYTRMFSLGSIFGEAFIVVTEGFWLYSSIPERWVVTFLHQDGDDINVNIFAKLEKYLEKGEEDSLTYFFKQIREPLPV